MTAERCYETGCTEPCAERVYQPCGPGERVRHKYCTKNGIQSDCSGEHDGLDCVGDDYEKKGCNVLTEAQALVSQQADLITKIQECALDCNEHDDCNYPTVLGNKCN